MINKNKIRFILIGVIFLLSIMQLLTMNSYSTEGNDLSSLTNETEKIKSENIILMQKIASVSSINVISKRAEKLDIRQNIPLFFFNAPIPVAFNPDSAM